MQHTLMILNPGHFHAALVLRERHPALSRDVYVYAPEGPELTQFLKIAESFNQRAERPTDWVFHLRTGSDGVERALAEGKADIAVLAGRNDTKIYDIERLHRGGMNVFGDKPLTIDRAGVPVLERILNDGGPVLMDIMTERHDTAAILQHELAGMPEIFGGFAEEGEPAIEIESVHYLCKIVNGAPLVRPAWFFDVARQGAGIADVSTHFLDQAQWMVGGAFTFGRDLVLEEARCWRTAVPLAKFSASTGEAAFPASVAKDVSGDVLHLNCNGEFRCRLRGVAAKITVIWDLEAEPGGGDRLLQRLRGTRSVLTIRQSPQTGGRSELSVAPKDAAAERSLRAWCARRGFGAEPGEEGLKLVIPPEIRSTHEMHFASVRDEFLKSVDAGAVPEETRRNLAAKYALLAEAAARGA